VTWLALAALASAVAGIIVLLRRSHAQAQTIRRQLAREAALTARLDDYFERASDILIVHDRDLRISTLNRAAETALGYTREEVRALDPEWLFDQDYLNAVRRLIDAGPEAAAVTLRTDLLPRKGGRAPVEVNARALSGDGLVVGVTTIARDLGEPSRQESEIRQSQKMEAVGRLATGVAHDFNNLVTVLLGYSDELMESIPAGSEWRRPVEEVRRAAERASALTQQLLSFSRRETAAPQLIDLNAVAANLADMLRRLLGAEIRLDLQFGDVGLVRADPQQLAQILVNLAVNARDAMPLGGALLIETAAMQIDADVADVLPGPHVMLAVTDSGQGMTPEVRRRVFEPFFTTKKAGAGTGLGLSMVHALVGQNGGRITVESEPDRGTTFRIYFPLAAERPTHAPRPSAVRAAAAPRETVRGSGVVLLAEDDRSVRRLVVTELTRRGFDVIAAPDGRAALELAQGHHGQIDVLVTDVVMPRMNGADLARAMTGLRPGLPVLFISGHPERAGAGLDPTGVPNLLMKPFTADTLAARISALVGSPRA
jgi:PAS domain S-box-containing protein